MQPKYLFFDCMETIVDLYDLPSRSDYAAWAYYNSGVEDLWSGFEEFLSHYIKARDNLFRIYESNKEYDFYERLKLAVDYNDRIKEKNKRAITQKLYQHYWVTYRSKCFMEPEKKEALEELSKNYSLALVSNFKVKGGIEELITRAGVNKLFDFLTISIDYGWLKPYKGIYLEAIRQADCKPEDIIFIGDDYENDYITPKSLGMKAILYDPKNHYSEEDSITHFSMLKDKIIKIAK
ncbi:MAG: HAD family hydrolase [Mobilitalea sp.]